VSDLTGTVHTEHPSLRRAKQLCRQHREEALPELQERLQALERYRERLDLGCRARIAQVRRWGSGRACVHACMRLCVYVAVWTLVTTCVVPPCVCWYSFVRVLGGL
jgi:hypothetical protein